MNLLLDTHVVLWFKLAHPRLSPAATAAIEDEDNVLYFSAASAAEIGIKYAVGKLRLGQPPAAWVQSVMTELDMRPLSITITHATHLGDLPRHHNDPFDRILIAQAVMEGLTVVSGDPQLRRYPVKVLW
jgi:PIN domain nuclease of toxin-antitoxin system